MINQNKAQAAAPKLVKYIPLAFAPSDTEAGWEVMTYTTSTSYVIPGCSNKISWDDSKYDGTVSVYFEAVIMVDNASGTAYAALTLGGGTTAITGSEVSTQATTFTRVRSGDIKANLVSGTPTDYECIIKTTAGRTVYISSARLVVMQSGTITKTETYMPFAYYARVTTSTSYVTPKSSGNSTTIPAYSLYTSANWSNVSNIYFEANVKISSGSYTAYAALYNTAGTPAYITNSEVSTTSTSKIRKRSSPLTLSNGTAYQMYVKVDNALGTGTYVGGFIIVQQSGAISATETHMCAGPDRHTINGNHNDVANYLWNTSEWSTLTNTVYSESTIAVSPNGYTGTMHSLDGGSEVTTDTEAGTTYVRHRSASWTPTNTNVIDLRFHSWGMNTHIFHAGDKIIAVVTLLTSPTVQTNAATSVTGTGATLNGNITATGGENSSDRGFDYRVQGASSWTSWTEAGSYGTGTFDHGISSLDSSTTYEFRAKATNSAGWGYGSTLTFTTDAPAINLSLSGSTTDFGNLSMIAIGTSSPNITVTVSTNAANGYTLYVKDQGSGAAAGLYKSSTACLIASSTATLSAGTEGYGIQASTSGGTVSSPYNATGNDVGGLQITFQSLGTSTGPTSGNHTYTVTHKAAISGTTQCGSYVDLITYTITGNF